MFHLNKKSYRLYRKITSIFVLVCFGFSMGLAPAHAQLPPVGQMFALTSGFQPPILRGMTVHPENPLLFDFIVDRGQDKMTDGPLKGESEKLIKYFLASMTIPDKDAWVNLSPFEKDRIIPDALGQTEMGKTMLEQDYMLKQLAASLTNPDTELGKKYWAKVGNGRDRSLQDLTKVWIVPAGATVVEKDGFAYITESKLDVMMEEDYQNMSSPQSLSGDPLLKMDSRFRGNDKESGNDKERENDTFNNQEPGTNHQEPSTAVFRSLILPKLIKEVNEGKTFAPTRQVYQSVILAAWYKKALKDSLLGKIYADKNKIEGITTDEKDIKQKVYDQYLEAFKKGVYNVIKEEEVGEATVPRKYFSGGENFNEPHIQYVNAASAVNEVLRKVASSSPTSEVLVTAATPESPEEQAAQFASAERRNQAISAASSALANSVYLNETEINNIPVAENVADLDRNAVARLIVTLGVYSTPELRQAAKLKLKEIAQKPLGAQYLQNISQELSDQNEKTFYIALLNNEIFRAEQRNVNPADFKFLVVHGQQIPLYVVHLTDLEPQQLGEGWIISDQKTDRHGNSLRQTFHVSINSTVGSINLGANWWAKKKYAVIVPMADYIDANRDQIIGGIEGDFMTFGSMHLPKTTVIMTSEGENYARVKATQYLAEKVGKENLFELTWGHISTGAAEPREALRALILKQGLLYGTHGSHWSMEVEIDIQYFLALYWVLKIRKPLIESWKIANPETRVIEDYNRNFPWWRKWHNTIAVGGDTADRYLRPIIRLFVENSDLPPIEIYDRWAGLYIDNVPVAERDYFRTMIDVGKKVIFDHDGNIRSFSENAFLLRDTEELEQQFPIDGDFLNIPYQTSIPPELLPEWRRKLAEVIAAIGPLWGEDFKNSITANLHYIDDNLLQQEIGNRVAVLAMHPGVSTIIETAGIDLSTAKEKLFQLWHFAMVDNTGRLRGMHDQREFIREFKKLLSITEGEYVFNNSLMKIHPGAFRLMTQENWQIIYLSKLARDKLIDLDKIPPDIQIWTDEGYRLFPEVIERIRELAAEGPPEQTRTPRSLHSIMEARAKVINKPSPIAKSSTASGSSSIAPAAPGGIDFDPSKLNLQIKRDGHGVPLPLPQQDVEHIEIKGLFPVILNISPVNAQTLPILSQVNVQPVAVLSKG